MEIKKIDDSKLYDQYQQPDAFDPKKAIIIIVFFMIITGSFWYALSKTSAVGSKNTTKNTFSFASSTPKTPQPTELQDSFYKGYVKIGDISASRESYPEKEYIVISIAQQNLSDVDITNWKLQNSKGEFVSIGKGTNLPSSGKVNPTSSIKVKGGDSLIVSTGRSPIGVSFQINSCSPYLEQFQDFIPPITGNCPQSWGMKDFYSLDVACENYINNTPNCTTNEKALPDSLSSTCKTYISTHVNYNGCTSSNKDESNFYGKEWRIFLGRSTEIWLQKKETITLLDGDGKLIDSKRN